MHRLLSIAAALALAASSSTATHADTTPAASIDSGWTWRDRTLADIDAIDRWVMQVYPGAVDPDNRTFRTAWPAAVAAARQHAAGVQSFEGWQFTLQPLVAALRDGHAGFRPMQPPANVRWAGFGVELRGNRYLIRGAQGGSALPGGEAELLSCDDVPIADFARDRLDLFLDDWSVPADRTFAVSRLLVDYGNPYRPAPQHCRVKDGSGERTLDLSWREVPLANLRPALNPFARVKSTKPGLTLDFLADGAAWVTVGSFSDSGGNAKLREAVAAARDRMLSVPYIVFDVRGNGGGNSALGDRLAETVWGAGSLVPAPKPSHPKQWRSSREAIAAIEQMRAAGATGSNPNPEIVAFSDRILPALRQALAQGKTLVVDPESATEQSAPPQSARPARTGPVFVLTDGGCFSSCILFVNLLKRMGAKQVGDPTDRNAVYGENAFDATLRSGLGHVMLPLAIFGRRPEELGGGPPDLPWTGAADDEDGLREFIADAARRQKATASTE